jgi:hypothetical protein
MPTKEEILASLSAGKILANTKSWAEHGMTDAMRNKLPNMTWSEANKLNKKQGYNKLYKGADKTSRLGYIKEGIQSLFGKYKPGSNIGGGTAITQKPFQNSTIKAITNHPLASKVATGVSRLGTAGLAYGLGDLAYNMGAMPSQRILEAKNAGNSLMNMLNPALTGLKNFAGIPGTIETKQQQEWMKNNLLERVRNSGSLSGGVNYLDYGSKTADQPSGDWTGGITGPQFAYGNTFGKGDYTIPEQGGKVNWDKSGTAYNFEKGRIPNWVANIVNKGGLMGSGTPQHYTPNITITPQDIQSIFGGGQMVHKGEPTITPPPPAPTVPTYNPPQGPAGFTQPTVQPTVQPRVNTVSPGRGNSRRAGSSRNYGVTGRRVVGGR